MSLRTRRSPLAFLLAATAAFAPATAFAVGPRAFTLEGFDRMQGGELSQVTIDSEGRISAGLALSKTAVSEASTAFSALDIGGGELLVGAAPDGKIYSVKGETVSLYADTKALAVTALAKGSDGKVYAATFPEGKIFRLERGKAELFATLPVENVFGLVAKKGALFAVAGGTATGGPPNRDGGTATGATTPTADGAESGGQVFRIDDRGKAETYWKSDEPQLVSIAADDAGNLYVGSSGKGLLYKVTGPGRSTVLHDFAGEEVRAVVTRGDAVYAIGNEYTEPAESPRKGAGNRPPGPAPASRARAGKGTLVRVDKSGLVETLWKSSEFGFNALALDGSDRVLVGTSAEGRVYRVTDDHTATMVFDGEERQVAALVAGADGFVLGSDPVVVHKSALGSGTEPTWTSKPLDAGLPARFGTLSWNGEGALVLETRSGNTQVPEGSWSTWEPVGKVGGAGESRGSIASPKARYLQIRARFVGDRRGVLSDISANFQTENARPIVTEISLSAKGGTLVRELGTGVVASGAEPAKRDTMIKLGWKVENADNDALRYRVSFRREGQTAFRELQKTDEFLTKTDFDWDTTGLAEGRYRVRVEASDDAANPLGTGQKHAKVSDTVVVDNTPPTLNATLDGRRLRGEAKDSTSPIVRVDVAIDGRSDFRPLAAKDGVFDSPDENLETDLAAVVPAGTHLVVVRVWDAAGNVTSKEFDAH